MGKVVLHHVDTEIIPGVESEVLFIPGCERRIFSKYKKENIKAVVRHVYL